MSVLRRFFLESAFGKDKISRLFTPLPRPFINSIGTRQFLNFHNCYHSSAPVLESYGRISYKDEQIKNIQGVLTYSSDLEEFGKAFNVISEDLMEIDNVMCSDAINWFSKAFHYNLSNGKLNRGLTVVKAYRILSGDRSSAEGLKLACMLGWCVEMLHAFFLMSDDIMDQSSTRRGQLCWYKNADVGFCAFNDSLFLNCGIYAILEKYFQTSECHKHLIHEFLQATRKTVYGQCLDMLSHPPNQRPKFECFTKERYNAIVEYKTSYYTYCLPVRLAMHLVGNVSKHEILLAELLCLKFGLLYQVQDDYLDCYGDYSITGKVGTDIVQGKCTWFVVNFLDVATEEEKKKLIDNYGISDSKAASEVLKLYEALALRKKFREFEASLRREISALMASLPSLGHSREVFTYLLQTVCSRQK